jgi:hypothetical protein
LDPILPLIHKKTKIFEKKKVKRDKENDMKIRKKIRDIEKKEMM